MTGPVQEEFVRRGGLLVPADVAGADEMAAVLREELVTARELAVAQQVQHRATVAELVERATRAGPAPGLPEPAGGTADDAGDGEVADAARLREQLAAARELVAVRAEDVWAQRAQATEHRIALADVEERATAAERARRERARDAAEADALAALYRRASASGARARIRAEIHGSAEMRALRVAAVRKVALVAGLPVLAAFAAWSTTGVQGGVVRLLDLADRSAAWWASWAVEPALITVVALVIVGRAVLRSSGGDTDWRAGLAEWTALGLSLALNIVGGWPGGGFWAGLGSALPHAIGPFGCAGTAALIALFDSYVASARPWDGAPRLADMDLAAPVPVAAAPPTAVPAVPVPLRPMTGGAERADRASGTGTGTRPVAAVPGRRSGTGPGRARTAVPAVSTGRRAISARTGAGTEGSGTGSATTAARAFWDAEVAAGRVPTGAQLARAAGKDNDRTGMFRRYAREWAAERGGGGSGAAAS